MKQNPKKLVKKTVFVFRSQQTIRKSETDPTTSSIIIISNETLISNR